MNIGTDIIYIDELPEIDTIDEQRFFLDNFTKSELDIILSKSNIKKEFALVFSVKESLVKCNKFLKGIPFNNIQVIDNNGNLFFKDCKISFSTNSRNIICTFVIKYK
tara:strand:- start:240 stop:560 length:321 start_codon:yes stop_codon:yes gene_type:complete